MGEFMYAPKVFVSMAAVLIAFFCAMLWTQDSVLSAFADSLLCAVLIQMGYFLGVLFLVWHEDMSRPARALDIPGKAVGPRS
ncbi:exopolysaccharide production repressor protein [Rhizobium sullae]|uniref:Exopolysaccharide production repressor n=2 Tax=Rhizobium sullae TaxID=50338 RepID=A0A4R3Q2I9_RHISU|nr:exopolysaccharide production repressor protein [Rhizobium sullae]TCU15313.1 exopolysaccharide production repressor [Rhizobium sullae]